MSYDTQSRPAAMPIILWPIQIPKVGLVTRGSTKACAPRTNTTLLRVSGVRAPLCQKEAHRNYRSSRIEIILYCSSTEEAVIAAQERRGCLQWPRRQSRLPAILTSPPAGLSTYSSSGQQDFYLGSDPNIRSRWAAARRQGPCRRLQRRGVQG